MLLTLSGTFAAARAENAGPIGFLLAVAIGLPLAAANFWMLQQAAYLSVRIIGRCSSLGSMCDSHWILGIREHSSVHYIEGKLMT